MVFIISTLLLCAAGCYAAVCSLTGRIGKKHQIEGEVGEISLNNSDLVIFSVQLPQPLNYQAGQFVYIDFKDGEGAHPFTVVSYDGKQRIELAIKALGDYTRDLPAKLQSGQSVCIEGPYGDFAYSQRESQVWIGAGIGITPFIAWLEELSRLNTTLDKTVTLYYCVQNPDSAPFLPRLQQLTSGRSDVRLEMIFSEQGEKLNAEGISQRHDLPETEVYFCGPQGFASTLNQQLTLLNLPVGRFHSEYFNFR
jgi:predicted ferric reductase